MDHRGSFADKAIGGDGVTDDRDQVSPDPVWRRWGQRLGMVAQHARQRFLAENLPGVAASLSYTSLLALVPLVSISVAVLTAFPVFDTARDDLQRLLFDVFVPTSGEAIQASVGRFVAATGKLTAVGVIGLAVTSVMLLVTIEKAFNGVFRVSRGRPLFGRLVVYWTILTLGPLLMGTAFVLSSYITAIGGAGVVWARAAMGEWIYHGAAHLLGALSLLLPHILTITAFGVLYRLVPNCRVSSRDAALGAVVAGLIFASVRFAFISFVVRGGAYHTIYGALATLPLFLLWMYVSWTIVLAGAVVTAALPEWRMIWQNGQLMPVHRIWVALEVLARLQEAGPAGVKRRALVSRGMPDHLTEEVLARLRKAYMVTRSDDGRWVLTANLNSIALSVLVNTMAGEQISLMTHSPDAPWAQSVHVCLTEAQKAHDDHLSLPLADVLGKAMSSSLGVLSDSSDSSAHSAPSESPVV